MEGDGKNLRELEKFLVAMLVFVFGVFMFPTMQDACANVNSTLTIAPLIKNFPLVFLAVCAIFPFYFLLRRNRR